MPAVINASHFHLVQLAHNLVAYSVSEHTPLLINSFSEALDIFRWHENYDPFSCVIVDHNSGEVLLVRDHLGIQPLFYWFQSGKLIFGNNLPDILDCISSTPPLEDEQILNLFSNKSIYSDKTIYLGINRVEPGHFIHIKTNGSIKKTVFWQLKSEGQALYYPTDQEYLDHFSALIHEAVKFVTRDQLKIAAEFSAGIDSSAIYCAAAAQGITPKLFMHTAIPGSKAALNYNNVYETKLLEHFQINDVRRIDHTHFEPMLVFKKYATWFAGPAPHIIYMFTDNIYQAVAKEGYSILLSGLGGDEGVSGQVPDHYLFPSLLQQKGYKAAWTITKKNRRGKNLLQSRKYVWDLVKHTHPRLHQFMEKLEEIMCQCNNAFKSSENRKIAVKHPMYSHFFSSLREAEWSFLTGPFSYDIRMRIEHCSIMSQKMGFYYRYPLLYPKLLEFYLNVPVNQKKQHGVGRSLMRRYLAQQLGSDLFNSYKKTEGLHAFSATLSTFKDQFAQGYFHKQFKHLPYPRLTENRHPHMKMANSIRVFMLKIYLTPEVFE